jgi:hypothetical protein
MFLEHPDITMMNRYGTLNLKEEKPVFCPVCGEECDTLFKRDGETVGCEMCIEEVDAYEEMTE